MLAKNVRSALASATFRRYIIVGVIAYVAEIISIYIFKDYAGLSGTLSVALAFWIGLTISFILQKFATFKSRDTSVITTGNQIFSYALLVLTNYLFTIGFVSLMSGILGVYLSRTIALGITTIWNYFLYKKVIFSETIVLSHKLLANVGKTTLLAVPIVIFCLPMLLSGPNTLFGGDFDMQIQMTEAAHITITEYNQFPHWNPWVSGGVPLFADPQFNILSPALLFSFFVDTTFAWKLTILVYLLVGFFGMKKLLVHLSRNAMSSSLFAYIWIFGSFFTLRAQGGHFTFLNLVLLPVFVYLLLNLTRSYKHALVLMLLVAYTLYSAVHYSTIFTILVLGALALTQAIDYIRRTSYSELRNYAALLSASVVGGILLALPRLVSTLEYLRSNRAIRTDNPELFIGLQSGLESLVVPYQNLNLARASFGPFEASNYIGLLSFILILASVIFYIITLLREKTSTSLLVILLFFLAIGLVSFLFGLGGAPFNELHKLPVFSSMRVSTRFFFIVTFSLIVVGSYSFSRVIRSEVRAKRLSVIAYGALSVAVLEVFIVGVSLNQQLWRSPQSVTDSTYDYTELSVPRAEKRWEADSTRPFINHAMTLATRNNHAQIFTDNALVNTNDIPTTLCDEDEENCSFVRSGNAVLVSWSPNRIELMRTGTGDIVLNMNVGRNWKVNNARVFEQQPIVSTMPITIPSSAADIYILTYSSF